MTVGSWLQQAEARLVEAGHPEARLDATLLLAHAMGISRSQVLAHTTDSLPSADLAETLLTRRLQHEPLAYILGYREFYGRSFFVGLGALIPRQETETLVDAALEVTPRGARIADVGTGSGCVGVTLALERPDLRLALIDVSPEALLLARDNARRLEADVKCVLGDALTMLPRLEIDLVVTNPPYVGTHDPLPPEVSQFEPALALFAGTDGMDFYRGLALQAQTVGWLLTEIGDGQADLVTEVFQDEGWHLVQTWADLGGRTRVLELRFAALP